MVVHPVQVGLDAALYEKPRPGQKPRITGDVEAGLVMFPSSDLPKGFARWTIQMLAGKLVELELVDSISDSAVCDRLKKNEIKPWKVEHFCIGKLSAQYVAKMEDVLSVYERPYDASLPVVCMDEGRKELRTTPRGSLPVETGQVKREDYEYERAGGANLYETFAHQEAFRLMQRFEWHYTPEHSSWLNVAKIELSILSRQCLSRRLNRAQLKEEVPA